MRTGVELSGDALTAWLGERAPVGDLTRIAQQKLEPVDLAAVQSEIGSDRVVQVVSSTPQLDAALRLP